MQARAEGLGGVFDIRSKPDGGTTITLDLPRYCLLYTSRCV